MDTTDKLMQAILVDQIILRAFLVEFVKSHIEKAEDRDAAKREILNRLYEFVDRYAVPGADAEVLDELKERARGNIDVLLGAPLHR